MNDLKHGAGKLYFSNGESIEGNFVMDIVEGDGVFRTLDGREIRGTWIDNKLV